ncbi:hypothetical protein H0H93_002183, partial [Arthromyces matolae]
EQSEVVAEADLARQLSAADAREGAVEESEPTTLTESVDPVKDDGLAPDAEDSVKVVEEIAPEVESPFDKVVAEETVQENVTLVESTHPAELDNDEGTPDDGNLASVESPATVEEAPTPVVEDQIGLSEPGPAIVAAEEVLKESAPIESPSVAEEVVSKELVDETSVHVIKAIPAGELSADDDAPSVEPSAVVEEVSIVPGQATSTESEHFIAEVPP